MRRRDIFSIYSSGLCELVLTALGAAIVVLFVFHGIGQAFGAPVDADAVLIFAWQVIVLMALWPGQSFWTIRRSTAGGVEHSIIGVPSDDDLRASNHRRARALRDAIRD